jgi:hypothetical protein
VAVALGQPGLGALVGGGADYLRELGFDEGLVDGLGGLADAVIDLRRLECVQDFDQCRVVEGHHALCPFARTIGVVSLTIARWPLCYAQLRRRGLATYTTRWDATRDTSCYRYWGEGVWTDYGAELARRATQIITHPES